MGAEAGAGPGFIGRTEVLEAVRRRFADACSGAGGVTLVVGETGLGKSTLVAELLREIRSRRVAVLVGRTTAGDDPLPFALVRSALDSVSAETALALERDRPVVDEPILLGFAPRLDDGAFSAQVSIEGRLLEALSGASEQTGAARDDLLRGIAEQFLAFARPGPAVVLLEDLHRADSSSLVAFEFLARELRGQPLWIFATCRTLSTLSDARRKRLEEFERSSRSETIVLRPMNSAETAEFLRTIEPSREIPPEEVARRHTETGGNPLLLLGLEHSDLSPARVPSMSTHDRPDLDEEAQRTLELAAVLGSEFGFALLLRASGEDEEHLTEVIDRLVGGGVLAEQPGEVLRFPDGGVREATYRLLPEGRRRLLHRRAGDALEALGGTGYSQGYALARHFYLAHAAEKSVRFNRIAADLAERALAPDLAWDYLSHALESQRELDPLDSDAESELVVELARITEEIGVLADAEAILREFLDRPRDESRLSLPRRAALEIFLSLVLTSRGELPAAASLASKVLGYPGLEGQPLLRVGAHHQLGMAAYYDGRYSEAVAHHTEEIRLAREVGNIRVLLRAQIWRVASLAMMGETRQAISETRALTVERDRLGSARESAQAHLFLGDILADGRSPPPEREKAVAEYAEAVRFAEQAKDPRRIGWALYKTAELVREAGRLDEATRAAEQACVFLGRVGDLVGLSVAKKVLGQIAMDQGALDRAQTELLEARELIRGLKHTLEEIDVILRLAQLAQRRGELPIARDFLAELERMHLDTVRPDLIGECAHLRQVLYAP
jgi:tetratricopeptide (TPR) repeat protein